MIRATDKEINRAQKNSNIIGYCLSACLVFVFIALGYFLMYDDGIATIETRLDRNIATRGEFINSKRSVCSDGKYDIIFKRSLVNIDTNLSIDFASLTLTVTKGCYSYPITQKITMDIIPGQYNIEATILYKPNLLRTIIKRLPSDTITIK